NVQVHTGGQATDEARRRVIEAARRLALADGFIELSNQADNGADSNRPASDVGSQPQPDRTILIGPSGPAPWIAVYDEATDGQDSRELTRLAEALSAAGAGQAVGVLDHDSDVLQLWLCRSGQTLDRFNNRPDYFGPISATEHGRLRGQAELWQELLVGGATV